MLNEQLNRIFFFNFKEALDLLKAMQISVCMTHGQCDTDMYFYFSTYI